MAAIGKADELRPGYPVNPSARITLRIDQIHGVLVVPSTHIQLTLAGRSTPVEYLQRLKRLIGGLDLNLAVIGYADPRAHA